MGKKNVLQLIETLTKPDDWLEWSPDLKYQIVESGSYPPFVASGLAQKSPFSMIICSGSNVGFTGWFIPYRVDKDAMDSEPYVYTYNYETGEEESGIIHHGDWEGRSNPYPSGSMSAVMTASGFDPSFTVKQFPNQKSGSIEDLVKGGYAEGFRKPEEIFKRKKGNKE